MTPDDIFLIRQCLPDTQSFPYYPGRESAWVMGHAMRGDTSVSALKQGPLAKLLTRPVLRPLVAQGSGRLVQRDVLALAHADRSMGWRDLAPATCTALEDIYAARWMDFRLSLDAWGCGRDWQWRQLSRKGGNLVLQLGFPSDHAALMGRYLQKGSRKDFEYWGHPVRTDGCPTLAWARLDVDIATGTALIEEIQSDWLRLLRWDIEKEARKAPMSRELKQKQIYEASLRARYEKLWPVAMLLATLTFLREHLGCHSIFLHQPGTGAALKSITGRHPPRSLYSSLPRSFCFEATEEVPVFLSRSRVLRKLARKKQPLFWHLAL